MYNVGGSCSCSCSCSCSDVGVAGGKSQVHKGSLPF
jgi:hypothetical protein